MHALNKHYPFLTVKASPYRSSTQPEHQEWCQQAPYQGTASQHQATTVLNYVCEHLCFISIYFVHMLARCVLSIFSLRQNLSIYWVGFCIGLPAWSLLLSLSRSSIQIFPGAMPNTGNKNNQTTGTLILSTWSPMWDSIPGLNPGTPGSRPGLKAGIKPLSHPGIAVSTGLFVRSHSSTLSLPFNKLEILQHFYPTQNIYIKTKLPILYLK
ncbi:unnamed protein product [Nyctereutes procyonoides]|uniref:(raccoon dog) hypothetical protein n=1 Tax=Nyctereutes procyonoides TaxID=34880 RepID=A0A811ZIQ6_NYCPR|nr:unnamed protein product [Nyctereutes procyonoides]